VHAAAASILHLQQLDLIFGEFKTQTLDDLVLLVDELGVAPRVAAVDRRRRGK
jgi:hypothetical protein